VVARLEALQKVEEVTEETQVEKNLPKMELPIWFDGKQINEILLYQTILQQHEIKSSTIFIICLIAKQIEKL
jgi:putative DNA primase/helicase